LNFNWESFPNNAGELTALPVLRARFLGNEKGRGIKSEGRGQWENRWNRNGDEGEGEMRM